MLMTSTHLFPGQMEENAPSECAQIKSYFCLSLISGLIFSLLPYCHLSLVPINWINAAVPPCLGPFMYLPVFLVFLSSLSLVCGF